MDNSMKQDQDRMRLFKQHGYDIAKARNFILTEAGVIRGQVLEVGTGRGYAAAALARKKIKLVSIDLDKHAQGAARSTLKKMKLDKHIVFKIMDAEKLQYPDNFFDCVVSVNFLHHADHPERCIKEMVRVAKGRLVIADLNKRGAKIMEKVHALDGHKHEVSRMSMAEAKKLLEVQGLSVKAYRDACQTVIVANKRLDAPRGG